MKATVFEVVRYQGRTYYPGEHIDNITPEAAKEIEDLSLGRVLPDPAPEDPAPETAEAPVEEAKPAPKKKAKKRSPAKAKR